MPVFTEDQHVRKHPKVMNSSGMALPDEERFEDYYWAVEIGYAWIAGFRPY